MKFRRSGMIAGMKKITKLIMLVVRIVKFTGWLSNGKIRCSLSEEKKIKDWLLEFHKNVGWLLE